MTEADDHSFPAPEAWRQWLEQNHDSATEVWVTFYKTKSGHPSITWPQSVDEALTFGWIDGQRKSIDDDRYKIRFTPRKKDSVWSAANVKRIQELTDAGRMHPAGLRAFEERAEEKTELYPYEKEYNELPPEYDKQFRANKKAWDFFQSQPPSYQHLCIWWVVSAKQQATRDKRMATLIEDSANGLKSATFKRAKGGSWSDPPSSRPN